MIIGTVLFTYHRNVHTEKVIKALSENDILPEKLYIFQDGIKESTNYDGWNKVNDLIQNINWCETEVHVSETNKGIERTVVDGINYAFQECDAVIVLEDDCVTHRQFMRFMKQALNYYRNEEKVYCVSGYAWDVDLSIQNNDSYFSGRSCSTGWGTWKEKWSQYEGDYRILSKIMNNPEAYERLQVWGRDLPEMLIGNLQDKCDAWDVFWSLKIIEKDGYCVSPYRQMVHNIGFDGSGVHSGKRQENRIGWEDDNKKIFSFPKKIEVNNECKEEFQFLFPGKTMEEKLKLYQDILLDWIQTKQEGKSVQIPKGCGNRIAVWGKNKIFDSLLHEIEKLLSIEYIIESRPSMEEYKGYPIIRFCDLPQEIKDIIVIPYFDLDIIRAKAKKMRSDIRLWGINELF